MIDSFFYPQFHYTTGVSEMKIFVNTERKLFVEY